MKKEDILRKSIELFGSKRQLTKETPLKETQKFENTKNKISSVMSWMKERLDEETKELDNIAQKLNNHKKEHSNNLS